MKVYTIEWNGYDTVFIVASFSKKEDRDETWRRINAVPMQDFGAEYGVQCVFPQRVVNVGRRMGLTDNKEEGFTCAECEILDAPCEVVDVTSEYLLGEAGGGE